MSISQYVGLISIVGSLTLLDFFTNKLDCSMQDRPLYHRRDVLHSENESVLGVFSDRDGDHQVASDQLAAHYPGVSSNILVKQVVEAKLGSEASHHLKITRQPRVDDHLEVVTDREVICPSCCASEKHNGSSPEAWSLMATVAQIMNGLRAPYALHSDSLLGLVRDCDLLGDDEVDFALERHWFIYNFQKFRTALTGVGLTTVHKYGSIVERGYQETWSRGKVRIRIISYDDAPNGFTWAQWTRFGETRNPCFTLALNFAQYSWKGVDVRIPVPVNLALEATYGSNYMTKQSWIVDKHPFEYSCKTKDALDYDHWKSSVPRLQSSVRRGLNEVERVFEAEVDRESTHHLEIARQPNINDSSEVVFGLDLGCPDCCTSDKFGTSTPNAWSVLATVAPILNRLRAPYVLHLGTLLGLVKECDLLEKDNVDFAIERQWLIQNFHTLRTAWASAGLKMVREYGTIGERGYEEAWSKDTVNIDITSYDVAPNGFSWALWRGRGETPNPCFTPALNSERYTWKGVDVRIPVPVKPALEAIYGSNYMTTHLGIWNKLGSCKQKYTFEDFHRQSSGLLLQSTMPRLQSNAPTGHNEEGRVLEAKPDREGTHYVEVVRQPKVDDRLQAMPDGGNICPGCCSSVKFRNSYRTAWSVMSTVASVLNTMSAPFVLHGGALLGLVRDCDLLDQDDIDFAIERQWFRQNVHKVNAALVGFGFETVRDYGSLGGRGYEVALMKDSVKVDFISYDVASNGFSWALWTGAGRTRNDCFTPALSFERYTWKGVDVRIPVPVKPALEATYGSEYMKKQSWIWNKHPFEHSCKQKDPFEYFDWQWQSPNLKSSVSSSRSKVSTTRQNRHK